MSRKAAAPPGSSDKTTRWHRQRTVWSEARLRRGRSNNDTALFDWNVSSYHYAPMRKVTRKACGTFMHQSNEQELRAVVKSIMLAEHADDPNTRILDELALRHGAARVDIAVVNGSIHGFELKSDCDNLKRLPYQIQIYNSVLDKVTLIVSARHAEKAIRLVPAWWGVTIAKSKALARFDFETARKPTSNPCIDPISVCRLLWREEALNLLAEFGAASPVRHKARAAIYVRLSEVADLETIQRRVRHQLRSRTAWRSDPPQS